MLKHFCIKVRKRDVVSTSRCFTWSSTEFKPESFKKPHMPRVGHFIEIFTAKLGFRMSRYAPLYFASNN